MKRDNDLRTDWGAGMLSWGFVSIVIGVLCLAATWASVYFLSGPSSSSSAGTQAMMGSLFFSFIACSLLLFGTLMVILGFVFRGPKEKPQMDGVACGECGRVNAVTTRICPRCMTKV